MILKNSSFDERYLEYIDLFNERLFYDCHEVLEDLWLDEADPEVRQYYKALIQYAAALLLLFRRNHSGATARFQTALLYFQIFPKFHQGLDLECIRVNIKFWLDQLSMGEKRPVYEDAKVPRLQLR